MVFQTVPIGNTMGPVTWRSKPSPAAKKAAKHLLDKLALSSRYGFDPQAEYRLPEESRSAGEANGLSKDAKFYR